MVTFHEIIEEPISHADSLPQIEKLLSNAEGLQNTQETLECEEESSQLHERSGSNDYDSNNNNNNNNDPEPTSSNVQNSKKGFKYSRHRRVTQNAGKKVILSDSERAEFDCIT